jgi:hypothetical protein
MCASAETNRRTTGAGRSCASMGCAYRKKLAQRSLRRCFLPTGAPGRNDAMTMPGNFAPLIAGISQIEWVACCRELWAMMLPPAERRTGRPATRSRTVERRCANGRSTCAELIETLARDGIDSGMLAFPVMSVRRSTSSIGCPSRPS